MASVYNAENTAYKTANYPLMLGQSMGLLDTVHRVHPELFDLYKKLKEQDWSEDEVSLESSRKDFESCPKSISDVMLETIMWQYVGDSIAAQSIIQTFGPFASNTEYFLALMRWSENESLHALTYSEIVRLCVKQPKAVLQRVMENQSVLNRSQILIEKFDELKVAGLKYQLGEEMDEEELRRTILRGQLALTGLEALEFMASFACTFALARQGLFIGIAQLVQKIALDEQVHVEMNYKIFEILLKDKKWKASFNAILPEVKEILDEIVRQEEMWSDYIFSQGRAIVGLNSTLLKEWVYYNAQGLYAFLGVPFDFPVIKAHPVPFINEWLNIDMQQNANQEQANTSYKLNTSVQDFADNEELDFE